GAGIEAGAEARLQSSSAAFTRISPLPAHGPGWRSARRALRSPGGGIRDVHAGPGEEREDGHRRYGSGREEDVALLRTLLRPEERDEYAADGARHDQGVPALLPGRQPAAGAGARSRRSEVSGISR